ncbi:MAG: ribosome small subunit-dependent GTPase A [Burkholderiales bacterium]
MPPVSRSAGPSEHATSGAAGFNGEIVAAYGRQFVVESAAGALVRCVTRGKRTELACGDRVAFAPTGPDEGVIESVAPRSSLMHRAAVHRTKLLAANVTQVAIIVAVEPSYSDELMSRAIVAAEATGLRVFIVLNKMDLPTSPTARARLAPFERAGYPVVELAAIVDIEPLRTHLEGKRTVLIGQSGMGKSTIVNALVPGTEAATAEISKFLASGRHTTTHSRLYRLPGYAEPTTLIDCPGMQEFGLAHLTRGDIEQGFREARPYFGQCRFSDCRHLTEPDCALKTAVEAGAIDPRRFALMQRILSVEARR